MDWLTSLDASLTSHGLVFAGGLLAGLSPCTLPTVAVIVAYVGGYGKGPLRALWISGAFTLSLALTLAAVGWFAALAGGIFRDSLLMTLVAGGVSITMGLALLGVFAWSLPGASLGQTGRRGVLGAFLLGIPFAFAASPCTTPVTVAVLAYAAKIGTPVWGATLLFAYAIGRSLPLLVAGVLAGSALTLTVSEVWTTRARTASGVILIGAGLYLLWMGL